MSEHEAKGDDWDEGGWTHRGEEKFGVGCVVVGCEGLVVTGPKMMAANEDEGQVGSKSDI